MRDNLGGSLTKLAYYSTVKFKINKVVKDEKELYDVSETEKLTPRCGALFRSFFTAIKRIEQSGTY